MIALFVSEAEPRTLRRSREGIFARENDVFVRYYVATKFLREYIQSFLRVTVNVTMTSSINFNLVSTFCFFRLIKFCGRKKLLLTSVSYLTAKAH